MATPMKSRKLGICRTTGEESKTKCEKLLYRPRSLTTEANLPVPNPSAFGRSEKKSNNNYKNTPNTPIKKSPTEDKTLFTEAQIQLQNLYSQIEKLAETKTSIVFKAIDNNTQNPCVIKHLQSNYLKTSEAQKSALLEYKNAKKLSHPNIVNYQSFVHYGPWIYIQMEFCQFGSLEAYMGTVSLRDNNTETDIFWYLALDILMGLKYMHSKGFAHLDIKPANIFLVPRANSLIPSAKIGDFGLSVKIGSVHQKKMKKGDGRYLAPEILNRDQTIADKADIYSLGITFYEMGSPFEASPALWEELVQLNGQIQFPYLSPHLNQLLRRMLLLDPELRSSAVSLLLFSEKFQEISRSAGIVISVLDEVDETLMEEEEEEQNMTFRSIPEKGTPTKVSSFYNNYTQDTVRKKLLFQ